MYNRENHQKISTFSRFLFFLISIVNYFMYRNRPVALVYLSEPWLYSTVITILYFLMHDAMFIVKTALNIVFLTRRIGWILTAFGFSRDTSQKCLLSPFSANRDTTIFIPETCSNGVALAAPFFLKIFNLRGRGLNPYPKQILLLI